MRRYDTILHLSRPASPVHHAADTHHFSSLETYCAGCRSIARDREDRRKASAEEERLVSTGMDPERAAKEAAATANQGPRRRTKPPSLVLLDAATEEAMKKEAALKRQREGDGTAGGDSASDSGRGGPSSTGAPRNVQKRLKTETGAAPTKTTAAGAGLDALLQRERERNRVAAAKDDSSGSGAPDTSKAAGPQKQPAEQADHISLRTYILMLNNRPPSHGKAHVGLPAYWCSPPSC